MTKRREYHFLILTLTALALCASSCSVTKNFTADQYLLKANKMDIQGYKKLENRQTVREALKQIASQKPNTKIFGFLPVQLWFYTAANKGKDNKVNWWIKNKVGEAPVILDTTLTTKSDRAIQNYMQNYGYFNATVSHEVKYKKKKATVTYHIVPNEFWTVGRVLFPNPTYVTDSITWQRHRQTLLKTGKRFDITTLKAERERIEGDLKNSGFYFFTKDYVSFDLDTAEMHRVVNINVRINQPSDSAVHEQYRINNIYTTTDFGTERAGRIVKRDTLAMPEFYFISRKPKYKIGILLDGIYFKKNQLYQRDNYQNTIRRFSDLGAFKFVAVDFAKANREGNYLDAIISLTPAKQHGWGVELQFNYSNEGFFGVSGGLSYRNRNLFKSSDLLVIEPNAGVQFQLDPNRKTQIITNNVSVNVSYYYPRFLFPFLKHSRFKGQRPKTKLSLSYGYEKRFDFDSLSNRVFYYTLHNFSATFGYQWEPNMFLKHELNPLYFSVYLLPKRGLDFENRLDGNASLKSSYQERFILGSNYSVYFTTQKSQTDASYIYNRTNIEAAGNLLMAGFSLANLSGKDTLPYRIGSREFAQYFRIENEFRGFARFDRHVSFAGRIFAGIGVPYGNSTTMPFIKQFYTGGPSSMRGFRIREIGPGSYASEGFDDASRPVGFFNQTGDIKIELNGEFRFDIYKFIKAAVFVDVGNVWLLNKDVNRPGANFDFKRFWNEFAVNFGPGVRLDFNFFVIRLDYGIPVRDPRYTTNQWRFKTGNSFGQFQLAVGYPF